MAEGSVHRTTRHHRCDFRFLEVLEEDFGIGQFSLRAAFMGVPPAPKRQAIELCEWATEKAADPEEAGDLIRAEKAGAFRWESATTLEEVLGGQRPVGRSVVFKSVGHSLWDLAAARTAFS